MAPNPIATLKKGLAEFSKKVKAHKDKLTDMLAKNEKISDDDEHWLDHEANMVDEQRVLNILETASESDYKKELGRLDANSKGIVNKLREWAGDKVAGQKHQREDPLLCMMDSEKLNIYL